MKKVLAAICLLCGLVSQPIPADSFDLDAHMAMSERAVVSSDLDRYLKNRLAFPQGTEGEISDGTNPLRIVEWVQRGAEFEDSPVVRVRHHFHNPIRTWDQAGLRVAGIQIGESSVIWGQNRGQTIGGKHSWHDARAAFLLALTSQDEAERQRAYTEVFQSLGQLIHLIQDSASPAHTRNDAHLCCLLGVGDPDEFHWWADLADNRAEALALPSQRFDPSILALPPNPLAPIPIARIMDTERYRQTGLPEAGLNIGLAEYSNANFFSDDTIFSDLPFPAVSSIVLGEPETDLKTLEQRRYFKKVGDGEIVDHLAVPSALYEFLPEALRDRKKGLDHMVFRDYAAKLLPRAVGYSAGLIDYFFRGQLAVRAVPGGLRVMNTSSEAMAPYVDSVTGQTVGSVSVLYDQSDGNETRRTELVTLELTAPLEPGQETEVLSFSLPLDNSRPGQYIVVFRGKLGAEEGAVVGKVTTPIQIYYVSRREGVDKIYRMDIDGENKTVLYDSTDPTVLLGKPAPGPDGTRVAFTVHHPSGEAEVWLLDVSLRAASLLTTGEWPSWSPDGRQLVFERELGPGDRAIFRRDVETGNETQLTDVAGSSADSRPAWAPQDDRIAYSRWNNEAADCLSTAEPNIFLIDSSGTPIGPATCRAGKEPDATFPWNRYALDGAPAWSPTGEEIVFTRKRLDGVDQDTGEYLAFREELFKVTVADETVSKLTDSNGRDYAELTPSWSPDGKTIAVGSQRDGDYDIWLVDPNGGYVQNLTPENQETDSFPAFLWVP